MSINKKDKNLRVDLHMHSTQSDGSISLEDLLKEILEKNIKVFSITEHDSIESILKISKFAEENNICYIPGVEISSTIDGGTIHILGYGIDYKNQKLNEFLIKNYPLFRQVEDEDMNVTFPSPEFAIEAIVAAGGVPILAHPGAPFYTPDYKGFINYMLEQGIKGIECYHPQNNSEVTKYCLEICGNNNLFITGGSDYHGDCIPSRKLGMPYITLDDINLKDLISKTH